MEFLKEGILILLIEGIILTTMQIHITATMQSTDRTLILKCVLAYMYVDNHIHVVHTSKFLGILITSIYFGLD